MTQMNKSDYLTYLEGLATNNEGERFFSSIAKRPISRMEMVHMAYAARKNSNMNLFRQIYENPKKKCMIL